MVVITLSRWIINDHYHPEQVGINGHYHPEQVGINGHYHPEQVGINGPGIAVPTYKQNLQLRLT